METAEPLDENTMLEALKIADHLERIAAKLKGLGSRLSTIESPSLGEWFYERGCQVKTLHLLLESFCFF